MIKLTRMNGTVIYLNPHLIERIEAHPDTVITMSSQIQYLVKESVDEITNLIINYRKSLYIKGEE